MNDRLVKTLSQLHTAIFRVTDGRIGRRLVDNDMLLLTTIGARTGRPHTVPLLYLRVGERVVVIASYGGRPDNPQWYENLCSNERAEVRIAGDRFDVVASTMEGDDRSAWWPKVVDAYDDYAAYQRRTEREIPLVWLDPVV